ncbi:MAG: alpha-L-rhamnosidase C-terminal domain-containing protein [Ignavibacteria bacterium]|jgi:hypothetical protein
MKKYLICILIAFIAGCNMENSEQNYIPNDNIARENFGKVIKDERVREYVYPTRMVWSTKDDSKSQIRKKELLITTEEDQATLENSTDCCIMENNGEAPSILLDFGKEIHGGISIMVGMMEKQVPVKFRVRFGESVSEAMSEIGGTTNATNDHAVRDMIVTAPWLGTIEVGSTGFRFVRIDMIEKGRKIPVIAVRGTFTYRDIDYCGSFNSSDALLNKIWNTGAYTVHLCMQDYIWDGIKRDRLVWLGDMHPEVKTIFSVFGGHDIINKSLDLAKIKTPVPNWMNGISSYSMWWLIIQRDLYQYTGNLEYLKEQKEYIAQLLNYLSTFINDNNEENLDGNRFLDWPTQADEKAVHAGLQSLLIRTMEAGEEMGTLLDLPETVKTCSEAASKLKKHIPDPGQSKQAAALMSLAGLKDAKEINEKVLAVGGAEHLSTFYGYYVLEARQKAGDTQGCLDVIRDYWGGMLKMGATTFWEHFDMEWVNNAAPIDELVPPGKVDIHGDKGEYCYIGFRHSLCHGWASGPTAWMSEYVLGIKPNEPGFKSVKIEPHLGDLEWVEGTFPTPKGIIWVRHEKTKDGQISTEYKAPNGIEVIL